MNIKLIKCISILLILVILALALLVFPINKVQAKEQNTKDY